VVHEPHSEKTREGGNSGEELLETMTELDMVSVEDYSRNQIIVEQTSTSQTWDSRLLLLRT
jgi:hypothetical protein